MEDVRYKSRLDEQIDIEKEKLRKIEENNSMFQSLKDDQEKLKNLEESRFSRWFRSGTIKALRDSIKNTEKVIRDQQLKETTKTNFEDLKNHVKILEGKRNGRMERVLWEGFPERLDDNIKTAYLQRFRSLQPRINEDIACINVTLFGEIGVGKSSFLNTVVTALMNDPHVVYRDFQPAHSRTGLSKTSTFHYEMFQVEKTKDLPIRFYDCPGIDYGESNNMNFEVLEAVVNGHVKCDLELNTEEIINKRGKTYRKYPSLKNAMHCIVFVIKATTNINHDKILKKIKEFQQRIDGPRGVKQVVIVTYIDDLGVPNKDMENIFKYKCVKDICEEVSEFLEIEMQSVYPISNYKEEKEPNAAKNALALMALWDIFQCGNRHIQKKLEKRFDDDD